MNNIYEVIKEHSKSIIDLYYKDNENDSPVSDSSDDDIYEYDDYNENDEYFNDKLIMICMMIEYWSIFEN